MKRRYLFVNPPALCVSKWQLLQYPEPYPYGLLKLGTWLKKQGHAVRLVDLMEYRHYRPEYADLWPDNARPHSLKHSGGPAVANQLRTAYWLGEDMEGARARLADEPTPDEIWVTACLTFNWETASAVIRLCRERFPGTPIRFGGIYPTLLPEHAGLQGADHVYVGKMEEAENEFGDLSLYDTPPEIGIFNFATGCKNRCSFCVNHHWPPTLRFTSKRLLYYLLSARKTFGIRHFANWDPNVMLFTPPLTEFLDLLIGAGTDITLSFNMGIQSDRVTPDIAEKMLKANVTQMTIPFETSDPTMLKRFKKPYRFGAPVRTLALLRSVGFEIGRFHSCSLFGYDDEAVNYLFRTWAAMVLLGARPIFSPLAPVPGSAEWERLQPLIASKPLDELNGYLFPLLQSSEKVELYDRIIALVHQTTVEAGLALAPTLPAPYDGMVANEIEIARSLLKQQGVM